LLHAEIGAMVANKFVELLEGPFIEQQINPLASAELALFVLPLAALGAAALFSLSVPLAQLFEPIVMFSVITHIVVSFTGRVSVPHPHPASKVGCLLVACVAGWDRRGDRESLKLVLVEKRICLRHGLCVDLSPL